MDILKEIEDWYGSDSQLYRSARALNGGRLEQAFDEFKDVTGIDTTENLDEDDYQLFLDILDSWWVGQCQDETEWLYER